MSIEKALKANAPAILTGIGIVANFGAVYFTYKSSKKIAAVLADKSMTKEELLNILQEFYTPEKQAEYGVVGIRIKLLDR